MARSAARQRKPRGKKPPAARASSRPLPASPPQSRPRRVWAIALALGVLTCGLYLTDLRWDGDWDSLPARYLPFSILEEGDFYLDEFPWMRNLGPPYFLQHSPSGHWISTFPVAPAVVVTPLYVPVVWWMHARGISHDDTRFRIIAMMMERLSAALMTAASVVLVFLAACCLTSTGFAAAVAVVYGIGTSTWMISSQALWQHTLAELSLAGLSLFLLRRDTRGNAIAAGGFAALGGLARPTMGIFALLALLLIWRERRRHLVPFLILPAVGFALLLLYNAAVVGRLGGGYTDQINYVSNIGMPKLVAFAGLLVSPNRGLLFYSPVVLLALPILWRRQHNPTWLFYTMLGTFGYVLFYAGFKYWWAALVYGPRYLVDTLPAFALCAVPAAERLWRSRPGRAALGVLVAASIAVQAIGVYCSTRSWDLFPENVNLRPSRLWDFTDLQIVQAVRDGWHGGDLANLFWNGLTERRVGLLQPYKASQLASDIEVENDLPLHVVVGKMQKLVLRVTNRGNVTWPQFADWGFWHVAVAYSWRPEGKPPPDLTAVDPLGNFDDKAMLPHNLDPGETAEVVVPLRTPADPGTYNVDLDIVQLLRDNIGRFGPDRVTIPALVVR